MIGFLQPLALLGLAAAAIPILLHLIGRRLPPTVVFPAVRYLTATEREHSQRLKLRNLLLLILRTAIIVLLVLAASRPVLRVGAGMSHPPTALAIVVDNSLSSGAVVGGQRVLDVLIERGRHVISRTSAGDQVWLTLADGVPRRVGRGEAATILDSLTPWPVRLDLAEAVRVSARTVADAGLAGQEVVVLSDLQRTALPAGAVPAVRVLVWQPPTTPPNRGVDSAYAEPPVWSPEGAVVASVSDAVGEPTAVRLTSDGRDVARTVAEPGDRVILAGTAPRRGWLIARVELDPDELKADDHWWLAIWAANSAATRVDGGAGLFVAEAIQVLKQGGRAAEGSEVIITDRLTGGATVLFPPDDPSMIGGVNRALAARAINWRFGEQADGEWPITGDVGPAAGTTVYRRYRLRGSGPVLARVGAEPWMVRAGNVVIVASRMEEGWTTLPVSAAFIPFLDLLINRVAARESWIVRATPGAGVQLPPSAEAVLLSSGSVPVLSDRRFVTPLEPGVYFLAGRGGDTVGALEVNHDQRESRLAAADGREVRASLGPRTQVLGDRAFDRELFSGAKRAELAGGLLAAAILAALAEMAIATAGSATRRGDAPQVA